MDPSRDYARIAVLVLAVGILTGCASEPVRLPAMPEESVLADAQAMLKKARDAGADVSAPALMREARRRLLSARGILYRAAAASREPNETERRRVRWLADEARLDVRLAMARTRRAEVERRLAEVEAGFAELDAEVGP